ncbi:MAG: DUF2853 family protein [Sphingobacteriales bacterium]|jgi:hypothetical protein|nr:DUF2853 family protein [Sphingobacteriales bacterium]MBP9140779.1 DUF2853 family protein [Chitinophagales bacterium]MDA0197899.1 DUF2853 family protein [Bacteroidota bacterium]MBK6889747.1 DUF2853 family protein [Sphingobacteriales bacterium]MBK7527739.1 DUF2853 family protein [Sphingobacteriales bacterium]
MSKFDEKMAIYKAAVKELGLKISDDLLTKVAKGLGPSIYLGDASLVSGTDAEELTRIKNNFLIKKLGLTDSPDLDKGIKEAVAAMGAGNRQKHRAIVYALLVQKFKKESVYA